jgi:hypothetical protein
MQLKTRERFLKSTLATLPEAIGLKETIRPEMAVMAQSGYARFSIVFVKEQYPKAQYVRGV